MVHPKTATQHSQSNDPNNIPRSLSTYLPISIAQATSFTKFLCPGSSATASQRWNFCSNSQIWTWSPDPTTIIGGSNGEGFHDIQVQFSFAAWNSSCAEWQRRRFEWGILQGLSFIALPQEANFSSSWHHWTRIYEPFHLESMTPANWPEDLSKF